jgi:hypothetical protein
MPLITQSMARSWRRCARQYKYRYIDEIGRKKPAVPLLRGTILHEMIDARAIGEKDPMDILKGYEVKYKKLFREEKDEYGNLIDECKRIFIAYALHYADEPYTYERSEIPVFTDLGVDMRYSGTIDKVVIDKKNRRWIMDHKSHKQLPGEAQRLADIQLVLYVWAWNRWNPDQPVDGIIWDYIRTKPPAIPELLKNGELTKRANIDTDYATYLRAVKTNKLNPNDYADILSKLKAQPSTFFERVHLPHPSKELVDSIVVDLRDTGWMIHRTASITAPRNLTRDCSWCEFFNLCQAELRGLDSKFILKSQYEHVEPRHQHMTSKDES